MNKIIIIGRLVRDPELKACNNGTEVCNFTVAVDRQFKKGEGEETDFIDCTAWGKKGVFVNQYFAKGKGITVEGRMESRKWVDKDGNNRTFWGVTCDNVEFPVGGGKKNNDNADNANTSISDEERPAPEFSELQDSDEPLPF